MMRIISVLKRTMKKNFEKQIPVKIPVWQGELLQGKNVLITGGGSGIGYAIAEACVRTGASVIIAGRNEEKLNCACCRLQERSSGNKTITYVHMDLHDVSNIKEAFLKVIVQHSFPVDVLVNNAGVALGEDFGKTEMELFDQVMETNVRGTYFLSQLFSNYLIENSKQGNILNVCSSSGNRPAVSAYACSKWSQVGLTKGIAKKLIPYGIVVNAVAPGPTAGGMMEKTAAGNLKRESSPSGRYVTPEEIANLAVFLISDMGRMIVGETIYITGGMGTLTFDDVKY